MNKLMLVLSVFAVIGCTTAAPVVCDLEKQGASAVVAAIQTQCTCTGVAQMQTDILAKLGSLNVCTAAKDQKPGSVIGGLICGPILTGAFAKGCISLPAAWGCTGTNDASKALAAAIAFCQSKI